MIYISSSCVRNTSIKDSIIELVDYGYKNIELSGGTNYNEYSINDLIELKEKHSLNYICHNYFPPPPNDFVLNMASLDNDTFSKTLEHFKIAIDTSQKLGLSFFGMHAGFFLDVSVNEIGKELKTKVVYDREKSIEQFCKGFRELKEYSKIPLYIENNVLSKTNYNNYKRRINMLEIFDDYLELKEKIDFELLCDVAHLKVSSTTLGLDFEDELTNMIENSNYIHLSDNDGYHDQNLELKKESSLFNILKGQNLKNKIITLEIYEDISKINNTYRLVEGLVC